MLMVCDLCAGAIRKMHIYDRPDNWRLITDKKQGDVCPRCHAVYDWVREEIDESSSLLRQIMPVSTLQWRAPTAIERLKEAINAQD